MWATTFPTVACRYRTSTCCLARLTDLACRNGVTWCHVIIIPEAGQYGTVRVPACDASTPFYYCTIGGGGYNIV